MALHPPHHECLSHRLIAATVVAVAVGALTGRLGTAGGDTKRMSIAPAAQTVVSQARAMTQPRGPAADGASRLQLPTTWQRICHLPTTGRADSSRRVKYGSRLGPANNQCLAGQGGGQR